MTGRLQTCMDRPPQASTCSCGESVKLNAHSTEDKSRQDGKAKRF